jgi:hypothetical protein
VSRLQSFSSAISPYQGSSLNGSPAYSDDSPEGRIINEVVRAPTPLLTVTDAARMPFASLAATQGTQYALPALVQQYPANFLRQGNEFVHLPAIVENAESSPAAAREAAVRIRKLLSDPAGTPAYVQYNAFMLVRILVDNPGHTFTRNLDAKFVSTVKDLLRYARDLGVQQFMRQTLNALDAQRSWDQDLKPLLQMWEKEKSKLGRVNSSVCLHNASIMPDTFI